MKRALTVIGVFLIGMSVSLSAQAQDSGAIRIFDVPIDHVGMIVRDINESAKAYADVLGLPVPEIDLHADGIEFAAGYTGNRDATVKTAAFPLNGVTIELVQPVGGPSPWSDHLDQYGESMHHIGLHGVKDVAGSAALAVSMGGTLVVGGGPGATSAAIDMRSILGFTLALSELPGTRQTVPTQSPVSKFADNPVGYISLIVPDIEQSAAAFAKLIGASMPNNMPDIPIVYPPDYTGNRDAHTRLAMFPLSGISVAYTTAVGGPSPWTESLAKLGPTMHHLGILISGMKDKIAYFEEKGGKLVIGGADIGYCWVEIPQLSTVFELNGK